MSMGPTIIIFHETQFTDTLNECRNNQYINAETYIRDRLGVLKQDVSAFSKIRYFGVRRAQKMSNNGRGKKSMSSERDIVSEVEEAAFQNSSESEESDIFGRLREIIRLEVEDMAVRSPRSIALIFKTFQVSRASRSEATDTLICGITYIAECLS